MLEDNLQSNCYSYLCSKAKLVRIESIEEVIVTRILQFIIEIEKFLLLGLI